MKIENHVTSLEISKRLHELVIKQDSLFVWEYFYDKCYSVKYFCYALPKDNPSGIKIYSAYLASELLELLPDICYIRKSKINKGYWEGHVIEKGEDEVFVDENLSNACAKMLIHLIENEYIKNE